MEMVNGENMSNMEELSREKTPFVLRDLDMGFSSATREQDWRAKLRQWEIALFAAASALILDGKLGSMYSIGLLLFVELIFWFSEAGVIKTLKLIGLKTSAQERLLEVSDVEEFRRNIANWKFGTGPSLEAGKFHRRVGATLLCGFKPQLMLWHVMILGWVVVLYFLKIR